MRWTCRTRLVHESMQKDSDFKKTIAYAGGEVKDMKNDAVGIHPNDNTEIYVNDQKIIAVTGSKGNYVMMATKSLKQALKKTRIPFPAFA